MYNIWRACCEWLLVLASWSGALLFIPPLLFTVSHFRFVVPNGYAKRPFFPFFEPLASQIFILPFTGPRVRGVKKEGRDLDLSIKDEQHLKCIKRGDEHTCSGMERCKPWLNAGWHSREGLLFDLLQVRGSWENRICFQREKKSDGNNRAKKVIVIVFTLCRFQISSASALQHNLRLVIYYIFQSLQDLKKNICMSTLGNNNSWKYVYHNHTKNHNVTSSNGCRFIYFHLIIYLFIYFRWRPGRGEAEHMFLLSLQRHSAHTHNGNMLTLLTLSHCPP